MQRVITKIQLRIVFHQSVVTIQYNIKDQETLECVIIVLSTEPNT